MPFEFRDRDGRPIPGGTVNVSGASCAGCLFVIALTLIGAGVFVGSLITLLGRAVDVLL